MFTKLFLSIFLVAASMVVEGQTSLFTENFGTKTTLPTGWTSTSTTNGWAGSTSSSSNVYSGASGGANAIFNGTGTNGLTYTLTYSNSLSTVGYTNITILWGGRGTSTFNQAVTFDWSSDGTNWNNVSYTYTINGNAWALVNSGTRISLPAGAAGISNLRLRWTSTSGNTGNYRIDDVTVQGTASSDYYWNAAAGTNASGGTGNWTGSNNWKSAATAGSNLTFANGQTGVGNVYFPATAGTVTLGSSDVYTATGTTGFSFNSTGYILSSGSTSTTTLVGNVVLGNNVGLTLSPNTSTSNSGQLDINGSISGSGTAAITIDQNTSANDRINLVGTTPTISVPTTISGTGTGWGGYVMDNPTFSTGTISGNISVGSSLRLMLGATNNTGVNTLNVTGTISGAGGLYVTAGNAGSGAGTVKLSAANTYTGGTQVNSGANGTLQNGIADALPTTGILTSTKGIYDMNAFNQTLRSLKDGTSPSSNVVTNSGAVATLTLSQTNGDAHTFSGVMSGNINLVLNNSTSTGSNTLTLSGTNTFTGSTTVSYGGLTANNSSALGATTNPLTVNGSNSSVTFLASQTIGSLSGTGSSSVGITSGNKLTSSQSTNTSYAGVISSAGGLTKSGTGTLTLTGANTYTGATTVSGGSLFVNGSLNSFSAVSVAAGATLGGTGTAGNIALTGTISPGSAAATTGVFTSNATITFSTGGTYKFEISDANAFANAGGIDSLAAATIDFGSGAKDTIDITALPGIANFNPANNYSWVIAKASTGISNFLAGNITLKTSNFTPNAGSLNGGSFSISTISNYVFLSFTPAPFISCSALSAFGNVCIGSTPTATFTITGTNLSGANVTVAALSGFTYSTNGTNYFTSLNMIASFGSYSKLIYVKFTPVSGSYSGNIVVGGGGTASTVNVAASGTAIAVPTTPTCSTPAAVCQGTTATITGSGSTNATSYSYWDASTSGNAITTSTTPPGTVASNNMTTPTTLANGSYIYYVQGDNTTCSSTARQAVTVTINALPTNPTGTISAGANPACTSTTLTHSAPSVSIFWETSSSDQSNTTNTTQTPYTLSSTGTIYARTYNGTCFSSGTINSGSVTINNTPTTPTTPSNRSINAGSNTTFTTSSTNAASYIWEVSTNGGTNWTTVTNTGVYSTATTATLTITGATLGMNGYQYRATGVATSPCSNSSAGSAGTLTVTANYCNATWSLGSGNDYITLVKITGTTLNDAPTSGIASPYYTTKAASGSTTATLNTSTNYTLSLGAYTGGNYTDSIGVWVDTNQNGTYESKEFFGVVNFNTTNGPSTNSLTINMGTQTGSTRMRVLQNYNTVSITANGPCYASYDYGESADYTFTVQVPCTPPTITTQPSTSTQTLCSGVGSFTALTVATSAGSPTYQWYSNTSNSNSGGTSIPTATSASYTPSNTLAGTTYYYCVVTAAACPASSNPSGGITVNNTPTTPTTPSNQSVTSGGNTTFTTSSTNAASYIWEVSTNGGTNWTTVTNTGVYSTATTATLTITGATLGMNGYKYRATGVANSPCSNSSAGSAGTLTVNAGPCVTESFANIPASSASYSTRTWTGDNSFTWTATNARTDQTINSAAITINSSSLTSSAVSGGIGSITMTTKKPFSDADGNLTVTVNGTSVGTIPYTATATTSSINNINTSGSVTIVVSSSGARVTIDDLSWTCYCANATAVAGTAVTSCGRAATSIVSGASATNAVSTLWTTSGTGTFSNASSITNCTYTPSVADSLAGSVTLTLTSTANSGCSGATDTKTFTISTPPVITAQPTPTSQSICSGGAITALSFTATGASSYLWYSNTTSNNTTGTTTGITTAGYTPSNTLAGTTYYYCVISNAAGCGLPTKVDTVIVFTAPATPTSFTTSTTNPAPNQSGISYVVAAPSGATSYTWSYSGTGATISGNSLSGAGYTINSASGNSVSIDFSGTATSGTLSVVASSSCGSSAAKTLALTMCTTPTTQATVGTLTITSSSVAIPFSGGTGNNTIVKINTTNSFTSPTNGTTYTGSATYAGGEQTVYAGSGSTTGTISGLSSGTNYYYAVYTYNSCSSYPLYKSPAASAMFTTSQVNVTLATGCTTNSSQDLSWTFPTGGYDGVVVFARQGATPSGPGVTDASSFTYSSSDYTLANDYVAKGRVIYKGTGTSVTVTGLTSGASYTYKAYTYTNATSTTWSSGTQATVTASLPNVTSASATGANVSASVAWTLPTAGCFDTIMVVANAGSVVFTPSGDGSAYTANNTYTTSNQIVYIGPSTSATILGLTNGTTYTFKIFTRRGTQWSTGVSVTATPNTSTVFTPGDFAILAVNTAALSSGSADEICFVTFKPISPGTSFYITDNGYERATATKWGSTEGVAKFTRSAGTSTISAGTVLCLQGPDNSFTNYYDLFIGGSSDVSNWSIDPNVIGGGSSNFDLNSQDQVWIMQGGAWSNGSTAQNATYTGGTVLYGWSGIQWKTNIGNTGTTWTTAGSRLVPKTECFTTEVSGTTGSTSGKLKYTGSFASATKLGWIARINNAANWTAYTSNSNYASGGTDYKGAGANILIATATETDGKWIGTTDNNWFNCANWETRIVPDSTIDVVVNNSATNSGRIDGSLTNAYLYSNVASCHNLNLQSNTNVLTVPYVSGNTAALNVYGNLTIESATGGGAPGGKLSLNDGASGTPDGTLNLKGNWINNVGTAQFDEGEGTVNLTGTSTQTITTVDGAGETFYNLAVNNTAGVTMNDSVNVSGTMTFTGGKVTITSPRELNITNAATSAVNTGSTTSYLVGRMRRAVNASGSYDFPIGNSSYYQLGNVNFNSQTGVSSLLGYFNAHAGTKPDSSLCIINESYINAYLDNGYWTFTPNSPMTGGTYDITLNALGYTNAPTTGLLPPGGSSNIAFRFGIIKRANSASVWQGCGNKGGVNQNLGTHSNSSQAYTQGGTASVKRSGASGFSDFGIGMPKNNYALPVKLLYLQADPIANKYINVSWATASENNNNGFEVQRSTDGVNFAPIGWLNGQGYNIGKIEYNYPDYDVQAGVVYYYRLKQLDFDGKFEYTYIVSAKLATKDESLTIQVSPIPATSHLNININTTEAIVAKAKLFNIIGQEVRSVNLNLLRGDNADQLDISNLPSGTYLLTILSGIDSYSQKIKIER